MHELAPCPPNWANVFIPHLEDKLTRDGGDGHVRQKIDGLQTKVTRYLRVNALRCSRGP